MQSLRVFPVFLLFVMALALIGCERSNHRTISSQPELQKASPSSTETYASHDSALADGQEQVSNSTPMGNIAAEQSAAQAFERKIIRNGKLTIETDEPTQEQGKITSIAESHGGFVVTSEFKQNAGSQAITVTVRVPSTQFDDTLGKLRALGHVTVENISGQDVTEEFLDLEARIKTQKALEAQFLEIMKQAKNVSDALQVQSQIASVRTEIERMEGRRRFLENQASLSTITITLQSPAPILTASTDGFWQSIKQAFADGVNVAAQIILGLIRLVIILIPIALFILLPLGLVIRFLIRRLRAGKKIEPVPQTEG